MQDGMNILIYGGGAVGLGIASCLIRSPNTVDIIARDETVNCLRRDGLIRSGIFGSFQATPEAFGCYTSLAEVAQYGYDIILVCTKSYDTGNAAQDLREHYGGRDESTRIVLFQNGWGNAELFSSFFSKEQIFSARVITGFTRTQANEVAVTVHADAIHIGSLFGVDPARIGDLCEAITVGGIPCEPTHEIEKDLWAKMLYNCALNPLGAILNVPYGALAKHASSRLVMDHIVEEIFQVLAAAGYHTHWQKAADFLKMFYDKLVPDTAEHRSSTLQDLNANRKTEIEALNGAVIKLANEQGIEVPYNETIYQIIKFKEPHA
jgi:2-dehydropantoate 2-reductase